MYTDNNFNTTDVSEVDKDYFINEDYFQSTDSIEPTFLVPILIEVPHIENPQDITDVNVPSKYYLTVNRPSPYTLSNSSPSTSTPTHQKYGKYKPMEWTIETILELLHTSNDGRFVLADSKANNGSLSDDGQNTCKNVITLSQ